MLSMMQAICGEYVYAPGGNYFTEWNGTGLKCGTAKSRNMEGGAVTASTWYIVAGFCGEARHMETRR